MATIRQVRGRWQAMVRRRGVPPRCKSFDKRTDATRWARELEAEADRSGWVADTRLAEKTTLGELLTRYRNQVSPTKRSAHTERSRTVSAQSNKDQALDSLQKEASTCTAYYTIVQECGHDAGTSKAIYEQSKLRHKKAIDVSRMVGLGIKMSEEVMTARWKASMEEQMALMNGNCTNISSLESRHAARCKKLIENPASVLGEYTKK